MFLLVIYIKPVFYGKCLYCLKYRLVFCGIYSTVLTGYNSVAVVCVKSVYNTVVCKSNRILRLVAISERLMCAYGRRYSDIAKASYACKILAYFFCLIYKLSGL